MAAVWRLPIFPLILAAAAGLAVASQPSSAPPLVIRNVGIASMIRDGLDRGTVIVRGDRIAYVGPTEGMPEVPGACTVDGKGYVLIPGLIDLHTHVSKTRGSSLGLLVAHGVTTVRDLGGDHEELLTWRQEVKVGRRVGPRLLVAGPYLESAGNAARQHGTPLNEMVEPVERTRVGVGTPADATRIVALLAARGVDHVKIRTVEDRETYLAIGTAAQRHGLALAGHFQPYPFNDLFASGQQSIEHAFYPPLDERSPAERKAFFDRLARERVVVVPTLVVLEQLGGPDDAALKAVVQAADHPADGRRLLSAYLRADWREQLAEQGAERRPLYAGLHASTRRDLAEMRGAGVRVLAGTDIGVLNVFPGRSMHEELSLLVRDAGMTPLEALRAATLRAAEFLGLDREVGSIETGKQADLVLLDGNPLQDITHVSRIAGVVLRGRYFDPTGLAALLTEVASSPDIAANDWARVPGRSDGK